MATGRPNILIFIPHDLGDHLGCYGYGGCASPHLDALAADSARLTNYFAASPECSPSRGCMMTGLHTYQNGLVGLANFGWEIRAEVPHLAARLRSAGYETHLFGFQHETAGPPESLGYGTVHVAPAGNQIAPVCTAVNEFLQSRAGVGQAPWFACIGSREVHRPWPEATTVDPALIAVPPYLPDTAIMRREFACFYQNIAQLDAAIGTVLETLVATGQLENTLVIFTSDHGAPFPGAKATLYDPGLRIAMLMRWPDGGIGPGVHDQLLSNVDLTATILDICGLAPPAKSAGHSFLPLLTGQAYAPRDVVHGTLCYDVAYDPMICLRTTSHKYIRSFAVTPEDAHGADPAVLPTFAAGRWIRCDDFDVMANEAWTSLGEPGGPPPVEELYDLRVDPVEQYNLAASPAYARVLADLRQQLQAFMRETDSPLLHGHIAPSPRQVELNAHYRPGGPAYENQR